MLVCCVVDLFKGTFIILGGKLRVVNNFLKWNIKSGICVSTRKIKSGKILGKIFQN